MSYLARHDLAHVDPREIVGETGLGSSDELTDEQLDLEFPEVNKVVSKGFMRGNPLRLASSRNGHAAAANAAGYSSSGAAASSGGQPSPASILAETAAAMRGVSDATSGMSGVSGGTIVGATVLKADTEIYATQSVSINPVLTKAELFKQRASEAKLRGYEGVSCSECHNFTMVRNGTCLKCDTCGSTSGCS